LVLFSFLGQKPVWLGFFSLARFWLGFFGLAQFFSGLARVFSGFFRFGLGLIFLVLDL